MPVLMLSILSLKLPKFFFFFFFTYKPADLSFADSCVMREDQTRNYYLRGQGCSGSSSMVAEADRANSHEAGAYLQCGDQEGMGGP